MKYFIRSVKYFFYFSFLTLGVYPFADEVCKPFGRALRWSAPWSASGLQGGEGLTSCQDSGLLADADLHGVSGLSCDYLARLAHVGGYSLAQAL